MRHFRPDAPPRPAPPWYAGNPTVRPATAGPPPPDRAVVPVLRAAYLRGQLRELLARQASDTKALPGLRRALLEAIAREAPPC